LAKRCFDLGWVEQMSHSSAVFVTPPGQHGFLETFGIGEPKENANCIEGR
jgi:hypothetical protein